MDAAAVETPVGRWGAWSPRRVGAVVAILVAVAFVVNAAPWIGAPLGDSHDGRNAAVWGSSARALRAEPLGSRLGGLDLAHAPYANHPPGIVFATAVTSGLAGDRPIGVRLPAVLASLTTLAILAALLVRMRFGPLAVATGLVLAGTSAMFLGYGTMLDTPMLGLPATAAVLLILARVQRGDPPALWTVGVVGLLCGVTSWQAGLSALIGGAFLLVERDSRAMRSRLVVCLIGGSVAGLVLTFAWAWWAYGDVETLVDAFRVRSGSSVGWWSAQRSFVGYTYGPVRLAMVIAGAAVAVFRRRHRIVLGTSIAVPVVWDVMFREGAAIHDYWLYSGILAVAVGASVSVEAALDGVRSHAPRLRLGAVGAVVAVLVGLSFVGVVFPARPEVGTRAGLDGGRLAEALPSASGGDAVAVYTIEGNIADPADWSAWSSGGVSSPVSETELAVLARSHPDALVLIFAPRDTPLGEMTADGIVAQQGKYRLVRASVFAWG